MNSNLKHKVKDSVFTTLFGIPKYTLEMYKALHPEDQEVTEDDIDIITIENILVNRMFNDLGFLVKNNKLLILVEAQSTFSIKLSIRLFLYLASSFKKYIDKTEVDLYSDSDVLGYKDIRMVTDEKTGRKKKIKNKPLKYLPTPELYVLYTGENTDVPDELNISDLYLPNSEGEKILSLKVKIIKSHEKDDCVGQYFKFCKAANIMREKYPDDKSLAAKELVKYCLNNDILSEFLKEHEEEVYNMLDVLFDQERVNQIHEENLIIESEARGEARGKAIGEARGKAIGKAEERNNVIEAMRASGVPEEFIQATLNTLKEKHDEQ